MSPLLRPAQSKTMNDQGQGNAQPEFYQGISKNIYSQFISKP
jgi:hypothetical protein